MKTISERIKEAKVRIDKAMILASPVHYYSGTRCNATEEPEFLNGKYDTNDFTPEEQEQIALKFEAEAEWSDKNKGE